MKLRSLVFAAFLALPFATSFAQGEFSVGWAPPPLPVVVQPACPVAGYIWTPGYWGWDNYYNDYYWVPGVWVPPPRVGLLWTPGWWGWRNGAYAFNQGYWGPTVGFYGGINYGYGYTGNGYWGGRWSGNTFQYNTAVTHVNKTVTNNTYVNNSFTKNVNASRTSFNGGNGGIKAEPNAEQRAAMANKKEGPTSQQLERQKLASKDQNLRASVNKGKPNQEAIKSFNKTEGAGQGKGAQGLETAGGAAGAGGGNKAGNLSERQGQEAGAGKGGNEPGNVTERNLKKEGAETGAGKGQNNRADMAEHNRQGGGAGEGGAGKMAGNENKMKNEHQRNRENMGGNQAKMMHAGKMGQPGGHPGQQHTMNQMRNQQMRDAQMGGKHPQMQGGGNRQPKGQQQQQGKKKPNQQ
jgi:WXXGXW repeat (2 copies)